MDELTRLTLRVIALESKTLKPDSTVSDNFNARLVSLEETLKVLKEDIRILKESRQRQIAWNTDTTKQLVKLSQPKPSFWFRK